MATINITSQPAPVGDLLTPYAPVAYEIEATTAYGNAPIVKAQVYMNSNAYGIEFPQPHYRFAGGIYYFRFDVAEILRGYLSNTDTFNLGGNTNVIPADNEANAGFAKKAAFKVVFTLWEPAGTNGIYTNSGIDAASSDLFALNIAANQSLIESTIADYGAVLPFKFLTNAPIKQVLGANDKAYLSFFERGATRRGVAVKTYNASGVLQATNYIDIGKPLDSVFRVRRIAVGTADIALITSLANIAFYTITVVDDITLPTPNAISETRYYYINTDACERYNLHFLNIFGADDFIRFDDYTKTIATTKEDYTATVTAFPTSDARGKTVLNSVGRQTITLQKTGVFARVLPYIYEARNTVEAYIVPLNGNAYTAVVVKEVSDAEAEGTDAATRLVEIECEFANSDNAHQN